MNQVQNGGVASSRIVELFPEFISRKDKSPHRGRLQVPGMTTGCASGILGDDGDTNTTTIAFIPNRRVGNGGTVN